MFWLTQRWNVGESQSLCLDCSQYSCKSWSCAFWPWQHLQISCKPLARLEHWSTVCWKLPSWGLLLKGVGVSPKGAPHSSPGAHDLSQVTSGQLSLSALCFVCKPPRQAPGGRLPVMMPWWLMWEGGWLEQMVVKTRNRKWSGINLNIHFNSVI